MIEHLFSPLASSNKMHITLLFSYCKLFTHLGTKERHAFLDQMIRAVKNGANLTDEELQAEVDTILLAVS
jgi:hypothetical protein